MASGWHPRRATTRGHGAGRRRACERGSAIVDFVLVGALTALLFTAVIQLVLALYVRTTLIDCASEGARYGALADRTAHDGARRTAALVTASLNAGFAQRITAEDTIVDDLPVVEVEVRAPLPVLGLIGPRTLTVKGHALRERP